MHSLVISPSRHSLPGPCSVPLAEQDSGLSSKSCAGLAACVREGLERRARTRRAAGAPAGAADEDEAAEDEVEEELSAEQLAAALRRDGGTALVRFLLSGSKLAAAEDYAGQLARLFGSGQAGATSKDGQVSALPNSLVAALLRRTQPALCVAGAPGGGDPGGGGSLTVHIFDRASSTDGPGGLGKTLGEMHAASD